MAQEGLLVLPPLKMHLYWGKHSQVLRVLHSGVRGKWAEGVAGGFGAIFVFGPITQHSYFFLRVLC